PQGLAHRDVAHPELARDLILRERLVGPELTGRDRLAKHSGDQLMSGLPPAGREGAENLIELHRPSRGGAGEVGCEIIYYILPLPSSIPTGAWSPPHPCDTEASAWKP